MIKAQGKPETVLEFWFNQLSEKQRWSKDPKIDQLIVEEFGEHHRAATLGECDAWREHPEGRLAEILLLDQFSRHIYRDHAQSFAWDGMALALAQEAVRVGADQVLPSHQRLYLYMPYMHSESPLIHQEAMRLFNQEGLEDNLEFEKRHKVIIERFGRYPHRNATLGRKSTAEEVYFLLQPGSSF